MNRKTSKREEYDLSCAISNIESDISMILEDETDVNIVP